MLVLLWDNLLLQQKKQKNMHELSIAMSIIEIVEDYSNRESATNVLEVELEIGKLSGIDYDSLTFALEATIKNTKFENTRFVIDQVQAKARCINCNIEFEIEYLFSACPECKNFGIKVIQGQELRVKTLKVI
jgi:hydrogenase nickel incorporation protein HypA/HybF